MSANVLMRAARRVTTDRKAGTEPAASGVQKHDFLTPRPQQRRRDLVHVSHPIDASDTDPVSLHKVHG